MCLSKPAIVIILLVIASGTGISSTVGYSQCLPVMTFTGETAGDSFGASVCSAGDVNNDGTVDLIVGAPGGAADSSGRAYVYSGLTGALLYTFTGDAPGDIFGNSVSGAGDVDKDGYADLIVGAPGNDSSGINHGRAYLYSGKTGELLFTFADPVAVDGVGWSVSGAGDVDNDTYDDVIVGAPFHIFGRGQNHGGRAYVYSGRTGALLLTLFGQDGFEQQFGVSVSGAGDVNNDSHDDVIVGSWGNRAYVFSGKTGKLLHTFDGEGTLDKLGWSVSGAGDVNNDGYDDLIVGATRNDAGGNNAGRAYVYSGQLGTLLFTFTGETAGDNFGWSVSGCGDYNDDGFVDLIVGAQGNDAGGSDAGRVYVYSGFSGELINTITGESAGDWFGCSVSGAGDVNNDGVAEVFVGARQNDAGGDNSGRAYVYSVISSCGCCNTPGDATGNGEVTIADAIYIVNIVFQGAPLPDCVDEGDANGNNSLNIADAIYLVNLVFNSGPPPVCGTTGS